MRRALRLLAVSCAALLTIGAFNAYFAGAMSIQVLVSFVIVGLIVIWPSEILGTFLPGYFAKRDRPPSRKNGQ
jgi:hypothetical protein